MHALHQHFSRLLIVLVGTAAIGGCNTSIALTDEGTRVRHVERAELPGGCRVLSDVAIGIPPDAARPESREELIILMRNKAGQMGGNHVVVETAEQVPETTENPAWRGRGTAYTCEEPEEATTTGDGDTSPGDTSGGEDTAGGDDSGEDTGEGEGDSGGRSPEDDALIDDLLGDD